MAEVNAAELFFDFEGATENDPANEFGFEEPKPLCKFFKYREGLNDQVSQPHSTASTQYIEQADQRAIIADPNPTMAPLADPDMQQQWPAPSPIRQNMDASHFTYSESIAAYQPILQEEQQQATTPQANIQQQQQQPAPVPTSQGMVPIHNTHKPPPACCQMHTKMYQLEFAPYSWDKNLDPRPYMQQRPSASPSPITQHQDTPFPPTVVPRKLRPNHLLQRPTPLPQAHRPLPTKPSNKSAQKPPSTPPLTQQHQQTATHTIPLIQQLQRPLPLTTHQQSASPRPTPSPTKNPTTTTTKHPPLKPSKPTGITKKPARPPGRKPKDHNKAGFINSTVPPSEHFDTTKYGRNSLRGSGSEARLAEPWNRPSVRKITARAKGEERPSARTEKVVASHEP